MNLANTVVLYDMFRVVTRLVSKITSFRIVVYESFLLRLSLLRTQTLLMIFKETLMVSGIDGTY